LDVGRRMAAAMLLLLRIRLSYDKIRQSAAYSTLQSSEMKFLNGICSPRFFQPIFLKTVLFNSYGAGTGSETITCQK
jgi:hypothetical protein